MAKRFIDTEIFNDSWFMGLSVNAKLLYIYLFTNCDHAGIIDINWKLIAFQTGIKQLAKSYLSLIKEFNNRLIHLDSNYYFIPKFIKFQYPGFPKSKVRQQEGALKRLIEFNIWDEKNICFNEEKLKSKVSLNKELDNSYEHEHVNVSDNEDILKSKLSNEPEYREKEKYAEFVLMTNIEYEKLIKQYGEADVKLMIEKLDNYKGAGGKKYKSDYRAILSWVVDEILSNKKLSKSEIDIGRPLTQKEMRELQLKKQSK